MFLITLLLLSALCHGQTVIDVNVTAPNPARGGDEVVVKILYDVPSGPPSVILSNEPMRVVPVRGDEGNVHTGGAGGCEKDEYLVGL